MSSCRIHMSINLEAKKAGKERKYILSLAAFSFIMGLIDIDKLRNKKKEVPEHDYDKKVAGLEGKNHDYDKKLAGKNRGLAGSKRPQNAPKTGGWRSGLKPLVNKVLTFFFDKEPEKGI